MTEADSGRGAAEARVEIEYCTQCRWLPRAAWLAQELLGTFEGDLAEVTLVPGSGGVFVVRVDGTVIWDRADQGSPSRLPSNASSETGWRQGGIWVTANDECRRQVNTDPGAASEF